MNAESYTKIIRNLLITILCLIHVHYLYIIVVGMVETTGTGYRIDG
jgi:hypothetical protein